ncbi:O-antigen polysaccharide polymerase Wzy [Clostridiaceae bacterium]|nr:O-antigen polysaccharide polymerase Wzy [Clostridiaceae bacterium]
MNKSKILFTCIQFLLAFLSAVCLTASLFMEKGADVFLISILFLWLAGMVYSAADIRHRILLFFFFVTFFVFLLGRPLIGLCRGENWFDYAGWYYYSGADTGTALVIMYLSVLSVCLGALAGRRYLLSRHARGGGGRRKTDTGFACMYRRAMLFTAGILFCISMACSMAIGWEKIAFMANHSYADYYVSFHSGYPYVIYVFSTFTEYSLYFYLAAMPEKRSAFWMLLFYVLSAVPSLIVGQRNPIVSNVILAVIYYVLRDSYGSRERWMSAGEKALMAVGIPLGLIFLGMYNYIREGTAGALSGIGSIITDLFFKQGVTFSWLCSGLGAFELLPSGGTAGYTFGGILDYFRYGSLARLILGSDGLGQGNNILKATKGNSMAHHLSYALMGDQYLEGHGCGSSFLLEVYADFGFMGIVIFSLVLGFLLIWLAEFGRRGVFPFALLLSGIPGILFMARAEAIGGISFLFRMPFWCTALACQAGSLLLARRYAVGRTAAGAFQITARENAEVIISEREGVLYEYCSCDSRRKRAANESGYTEAVY